jgi:hypothetical protein
MRKNASTTRNAVIFALAGAFAPIASNVITLVAQGESIPGALSYVSDQIDEFVPASSFSALIWIITGLGLLRYGARSNQAGRMVLRLAATFAMTSIAPRLLDGGNALANVGTILNFPENIIAVLRAGGLFGLASWLQSAGSGAGANDTRWTRSPPIARGAHQVTRLLCGHALLGGASFRRTILGFFDERWTALAPEFGVDIRLVLRVATVERDRNDRFWLGFGAIGVFYLLIYTAWPGIVLIPLAGSVALYFVKARETRKRAKTFSADAFDLDRTLATPWLRDHHPPHWRGESEMSVTLPRADQNLIVYSGFNPFVGCGSELGGWSFVTFIDKPKLEGAPCSIQSFTTAQLYDAVTKAVTALNIPEFRCRDLFFASGTDVRDDKDVMWAGLASLPRQTLGGEVAERMP